MPAFVAGYACRFPGEAIARHAGAARVVGTCQGCRHCRSLPIIRRRRWMASIVQSGGAGEGRRCLPVARACVKKGRRQPREHGGVASTSGVADSGSSTCIWRRSSMKAAHISGPPSSGGFGADREVFAHRRWHHARARGCPGTDHRQRRHQFDRRLGQALVGRLLAVFARIVLLRLTRPSASESLQPRGGEDVRRAMPSSRPGQQVAKNGGDCRTSCRG